MTNKLIKAVGIISLQAAIVTLCVSNLVFAYSFATVSTSNSSISPTDQVARTGEKVYVTVQLMDQNRLPVTGHEVRLISSLSTDKIDSLTNLNLSDKDGRTKFAVSSENKGFAVYTAYDLTADTILTSKARVSYFSTTEDIFANPIGADPGTISYFKFEDLPATTTVETEVSPTITAYDATDQKFTTYTGTVHFSVKDGNENYVVLPIDYTFTEADLGSHTFSISFIFKQAGTYTIEVKDTSNASAFGQNVFTVTGGENNQNSGIKITNPTAGSYSNNLQVISGTASPATKLKIFDNETPIGEVTSDVEGAFSFTTSALADGEHKIFAASVNDVGTIVESSDELIITISTEAPSIGDVLILPSDSVDPASNVTVKITPKTSLSKASVIIGTEIYDFVPNADGSYEVTFTAPVKPDDYPISINVKDELNNETTFDAVKTLKVGALPAKKSVGDVSGVTAKPSDHKVTLGWDRVTSEAKIKNYRIYYGVAPKDLNSVIDTFSSDNSWYVQNLDNGMTYYFAVTALNVNGEESEYFSNVVSSIPNPTITDGSDPYIDNGASGNEYLNDLPSDKSNTGPEILWLIPFSALASYLGNKFTKKKKS